VSGGTRNYAYRVLDTVIATVEKTICKVRGITLNYNASRLVNFELIRDIILVPVRGGGSTHCREYRYREEIYAKDEGMRCNCIESHRTRK